MLFYPLQVVANPNLQFVVEYGGLTAPALNHFGEPFITNPTQLFSITTNLPNNSGFTLEQVLFNISTGSPFHPSHHHNDYYYEHSLPQWLTFAVGPTGQLIVHINLVPNGTLQLSFQALPGLLQSPNGALNLASTITTIYFDSATQPELNVGKVRNAHCIPD